MRPLRISLIVFGALVVLTLVADRVAVFIAEGEVASRTRDSLALPAEPDVSIRGFPFLTQVLGSRLDRVDLGLEAYEAQVDGRRLTLAELDVRLEDVELTGGYSGAVADRAEGEGLITYEELSRAYGALLEVSGTGFGIEFGDAGDGRLLLTLQAGMLGQRLDIGEMTGDIVLENGRVRLEVAEEDIPDAGRPGIRDAIREQLDVERSITGLPDGLSLESLVPAEDGLALTIAGSDVDITG